MDPGQYEEFKAGLDMKLGDGMTLNKFQRQVLYQHEAGTWLESNIFDPAKADRRAILEALSEYTSKDADKKFFFWGYERWRQIMRLIIGWHSDMLESEPIVFASIFHQHRTAQMLGSGSDDAET